MGMAIGMIGFLGFFVCIIWLIIRLIKRKPLKQAGIGLLACVVLFFCGVGISMATGEVETKKDDKPLKQQAEKEEGEKPTETEQAPSEEESASNPKSEPTSGQEDAQEALDEALGGSPGMFSKTVRNDVTGRWRLFRYSSSETIADHAVEYYNAYFESDDEIHWVINFGLKTTSCIKLLSGSLYIDVYEYVEKEEHDAKALGSGMLLDSYSVDLSSQEINDLSSVSKESGELVRMDRIEAAIISALPSDYQSSEWFFVNCDSTGDGTSFTDMQVDQKSDSEDNALSIASECFKIAKQETETLGLEFENFSITVVNGGAPIGLFSSTDGKTFTSISGGKRTEITIP